MKLRQLEKKDAEYMLEWMHDENINRFFCFDAARMNLDSVNQFIDNSNIEESNNKHFAIADENDEYMGTVSLKQIDECNKNAEYAISLRAKAQSKGYAKFATVEILKYAFYKLRLNKVYLNVLSYNVRAIKFYEKFGFTFEGEFKKHIFIHGKFNNIKWFSYLREDFR